VHDSETAFAAVPKARAPTDVDTPKPPPRGSWSAFLKEWSTMTSEDKLSFEELLGKFPEAEASGQKVVHDRVKKVKKAREAQKKSTKAKKDPSAPKRSKNSFIWYFLNAKAINQAMPVQAASESWKSMPEEEKAVFEAKAQRDGERYKTEMKEYISSGKAEAWAKAHKAEAWAKAHERIGKLEKKLEQKGKAVSDLKAHIKVSQDKLKDLKGKSQAIREDLEQQKKEQAQELAASLAGVQKAVDDRKAAAPPPPAAAAAEAEDMDLKEQDFLDAMGDDALGSFWQSMDGPARKKLAQSLNEALAFRRRKTIQTHTNAAASGPEGPRE